MPNLSSEMWTLRYLNGETGWDIGYPSNPLKEYVEKLTDKDLRILVPGGGNGYEAEFLHKNGFKNVILLDWSPEPLKAFAAKNVDSPPSNLVCDDFFLHNAQYDVVLEQTFFCAIDPKLRQQYAAKMYELLKPGGKLVGVLFNIPLNKDKPPFGGNADEYKAYFEPYFHFNHFETCYNSIPPRAGNELFIELVRMPYTD